MNPIQNGIDQASLKLSERVFRERLEKEPDDMNARLSLAWCLFLQALHQAGRESVAQALVARAEETETTDDSTHSLLDKNARALLREALQQAAAVRQLSPHPQDSTYMNLLQSLASLSGASQIVSGTEQEADRILSKLTSEMMLLHPARFYKDSAP
jgi:hypothetical protein